jgi:hypothetical protein
MLGEQLNETLAGFSTGFNESRLNPNLTTAQFFSSVNYLQHNVALSDLKGKTEFDQLTPGVDSLFNHFATFRYAENLLDKYEPDSHFVGYNLRHNFGNNLTDANSQIDQRARGANAPTAQQLNAIRSGIARSVTNAAIRARAAKETMSNPSADNIIKWSSLASSATVVGYQPYAWTDFAYCKYYGKIPNNRLITLRRYPFPVADVLKASAQSPIVPMAQAVTWFGGETGNKLSGIGNWVWDMPWEELEVKLQDIEGNEVLFDDLKGIIEGVGGKFGTGLSKVLEAVYQTAALSNNSDTAAEISGMDAKMQTYIRNLYNADKGPYWNRIYGPVNVIHKSSRRSRGIQTSWGTNFVIKFHYQFRSFSGMSPKMAALDLMSNFMALTHNDAQFLGQLSRYFPKPGLKFSPTTTQLLTNLMIKWGKGELGTKEAMESLNAMIKAEANVFSTVKDQLANDKTKVLGTAINSFALNKFKNAFPDILSVKSALSDRPVGEWHLVVGNPMQPIFVMGDLICVKTTAVFDEEIGPDDFPTGVTFEVTLKQGKPRDKTAIERMLNQGVGSLTATRLNPPSSADDTFGEENNNLYKEITGSNFSDENADPALQRYKDRVGLAYRYKNPGSQQNQQSNEAFINNIDSVMTTYFRKNITKS